MQSSGQYCFPPLPPPNPCQPPLPKPAAFVPNVPRAETSPCTVPALPLAPGLTSVPPRHPNQQSSGSPGAHSESQLTAPNPPSNLPARPPALPKPQTSGQKATQPSQPQVPSQGLPPPLVLQAKRPQDPTKVRTIGTSRRPIALLSFFDGIATAHQALEDIGAFVTVSWAWETDEDCRRTVAKRHPQIVQWGDVAGSAPEKVASLLDQHCTEHTLVVICGAPPCHDFSNIKGTGAPQALRVQSSCNGPTGSSVSERS